MIDDGEDGRSREMNELYGQSTCTVTRDVEQPEEELIGSGEGSGHHVEVRGGRRSVGTRLSEGSVEIGVKESEFG
jgi:hypothetical protein